jgi:hypothetical protein
MDYSNGDCIKQLAQMPWARTLTRLGTRLDHNRVGPSATLAVFPRLVELSLQVRGHFGCGLPPQLLTGCSLVHTVELEVEDHALTVKLLAALASLASLRTLSIQQHDVAQAETPSSQLLCPSDVRHLTQPTTLVVCSRPFLETSLAPLRTLTSLTALSLRYPQADQVYQSLGLRRTPDLGVLDFATLHHLPLRSVQSLTALSLRYPQADQVYQSLGLRRTPDLGVLDFATLHHLPLRSVQFRGVRGRWSQCLLNQLSQLSTLQTLVLERCASLSGRKVLAGLLDRRFRSLRPDVAIHCKGS